MPCTFPVRFPLKFAFTVVAVTIPTPPKLLPFASRPAASLGAGSSSSLVKALELIVIVLPSRAVVIDVPPASVIVLPSVIVTLPASAAISNCVTPALTSSVSSFESEDSVILLPATSDLNCSCFWCSII
jgi:hypothetical protein